MNDPQPGGCHMPTVEEIPELLAQYTTAQIEGDPLLKYLHDRINLPVSQQP